MKHFKEKYGPWAIVTGASAGIGKEIVKQVAREGLNVVIIARRENLLDDLKQEIERNYHVKVRSIAMDLLEPEAIKMLDEETKNLDVGLIIPNAGMELSGEFVDGDMQKNTALVQLNALVPMQIANVFGKRLKERGKGGILFLSSLFGYQGIPYVANYAASKAYILTLGEALNVELSPYGVDVAVLSPGLTATEMSANMNVDFKKMPIFSMHPSRAACIGLRTLGKKTTVVPGLLNKIYAWENRFIPRTWPVKLFGFLVHRALKP